MSTAMQTGAAQTGATIIPFPRRPLLRATVADAPRSGRETMQALPVIEWGGWYHDAAIAADKPVPHS